MNQPDDLDKFGTDLELQHRLNSLLSGEPPMESMPADDLHRGRRLVRRRRWGAVGTAAVLVPALAVGAAAASNGLFSGSSPAGGTKLVPADGTEPMPTDSECRLTRQPGDDASGGAETSRKIGGVPVHEQDEWPAEPDINGMDDCAFYTVDVETGRMLDRLRQLLTDQLDPSGANTDETIIDSSLEMEPNGAEWTDGIGTTGVVAGTSWIEGDREGAVAINVVKAGTTDVENGCDDGLLQGGPSVLCEEQPLPDGTVVLVGYGAQDGAERILVRHERDNGDVVMVTADEASDRWWENGSGPEPLEHAPVTVDQLIALATHEGAHF